MTAVSANGKTTEKHENGAHTNGTTNGTTNGSMNGNEISHVQKLQPVYYKPPQNLETFELSLRNHFEEKTNKKFGNFLFSKS